MTTINSPGRLGGVAELAAELGISRQQVANLRQREDFPEPVAALSMGEVWDLDVIRRWAGSGLRRPAGRPSQDRPVAAVGRRFVLGEQIGGGGFAEVYRALDILGTTPSGTEVAVKVLRPEYGLDALTLARFQRELQLMSQLSHPNVMPVLAAGNDENVGFWYGMPRALGSLFDDLPRFGELDPAVRDGAIVGVMREVCAGLAYIHGQGVLHRDLKPENVLRTCGGAWAIADFGLARAVAESTRLTASMGMGSMFYTAPEQWDNAKRVTQAADIYSAGRTLQAMLIGGTPVGDDVPPGRLGSVVRRATVRDPARRHQSAADLLADIEAAIAPDAWWEPPADKARRLRQQLAAAIDYKAVMEIINWADVAGDGELVEFALALSAVHGAVVQEWWGINSANFTHAFGVFAQALEHLMDFDYCDPLADFARLAVAVTGDRDILRDAIRGLALLGYRHNRWHVRDVAVEILQGIRSDSDAASALEGLQAAGGRATEWTAGRAVLGTLHPILRAGIPLLAAQPLAPPVTPMVPPVIPTAG